MAQMKSLSWSPMIGCLDQYAFSPFHRMVFSPKAVNQGSMFIFCPTHVSLAPRHYFILDPTLVKAA